MWRVGSESTAKEDISGRFSVGLWDAIDIGRGGRRGFSQKASFLEQGLQEGKFSQEYPFVLDESFCQERGARIGRDLVEQHAPQVPSASSSSCVNPYVESSDVVTPVTSTVSYRSFREITTEEESTARAKPKAKSSGSSSRVQVTATSVPEPEETLEYRPRYSRTQLVYKLLFAGRTESQEKIQLQLDGKPKSSVRLLLLDWHQVVDRSRSGTTWDLQKVPPENAKFLIDCIEAAQQSDRAFFIVILSYIDTDRRLGEVLGYINNSTGLSALVSFLLITRAERVGRAGKCAAVQDLLDQTGLCESQLCFIDDTKEVVEEFHSNTPQVSLVHIKLARKPQAASGIPQSKYLVDSLPLVQEWLRR
eukprot:Skav226537  [mRNA]  locus=scaffold4831:204211:206313:- [translate_table: standard]